MDIAGTLASNIPFLLIVALSIAVAVLIGIVISMHLKLKKFLVGIDSRNIADSLASVSSDLGDMQIFRKEMEAYLTSVEKRLRRSLQSVHTIRFNPWHGTGEGGSQSFATAFMNEEGDGVVISTLYSRDHVSIFGKTLKKHGSPHELSDEEQRAVEEASKGVK